MSQTHAVLPHDRRAPQPRPAQVSVALTGGPAKHTRQRASSLLKISPGAHVQEHPFPSQLAEGQPGDNS